MNGPHWIDLVLGSLVLVALTVSALLASERNSRGARIALLCAAGSALLAVVIFICAVVIRSADAQPI